MAELKHFWSGEIFQAAGTTLIWSWNTGEREHYWGYSVRPFQLNSHLEVQKQWTQSDNNWTWTENFQVFTTTGGLMRFSAIAVIGT